MLGNPFRTTSTTEADRTIARRLRRLRRHRGVALRAGAGAAVLIGVTAAVDGIVQLGTAPAPAAAAQTGAASDGPVRHRLVRDDLVPDEQAHAQHVIAQANAHARQEARRAAARRAARQAAARKAAAARPTRPAGQPASRSSIRDPRSAARALLADRGWSGQFGCLDALWRRESNWSSSAANPSSGAFGIPQALPGGKMASAGADWRTNPVTQITWGLGYIASTYGTPCGAWAHSQAYGWY